MVERCGGIDVGKKFLKVCVMTGPLSQEPEYEIRKVDCSHGQWEQLRQWLKSEGVPQVVMESRGPYGVPVFNLLEGEVKVVLANPVEVKKPERAQDRCGGCVVAGAFAATWHDPA